MEFATQHLNRLGHLGKVWVRGGGVVKRVQKQVSTGTCSWISENSRTKEISISCECAFHAEDTKRIKELIVTIQDTSLPRSWPSLNMDSRRQVALLFLFDEHVPADQTRLAPQLSMRLYVHVVKSHVVCLVDAKRL